MNNSRLYDEKTFYDAFVTDLNACRQEIVIESPFITSSRMRSLKSYFESLVERNVKVYVITRDPKEHSNGYDIEAEEEIQYFEAIGVQVLLCSGNHHRKLAILDRKILWEGSLNILSQAHSREIMRRIDSRKITEETMQFLKLSKFL